MTILVVDDIHENRYLLNVLFSSKGYQIVEAENGEQALAEIHKQTPQLIISDILMPVMDGFALCKELKADPEMSNIPFVFYTATYTEESDKDFALSLGADKFLTKPMGLNELVLEVESVMSRSGNGSQQAKQVNLDDFHEEHGKLLQNKLEQKVEQLESKNEQLLAKQRELNKLNEQLELLVSRRTALLTTSNKELEAFSSSIVSDLAGPLASIEKSSKALLDELSQGQLNEENKGQLQHIQASTQQMTEVLEDLANLASVNESEFKREPLDLAEIAREICASYQKENPQRNVSFRISENLKVFADAQLMKIALKNLLSNAWKFTRNTTKPVIEVGEEMEGGEQVYFVKDNGIGFNMGYADKLFLPFKDQHPQTQFEGSGIGLATVQRIIHRHEGFIWAYSEPDKGASFYFSLPG